MGQRANGPGGQPRPQTVSLRAERRYHLPNGFVVWFPLKGELSKCSHDSTLDKDRDLTSNRRFDGGGKFQLLFNHRIPSGHSHRRWMAPDPH